MIELFHAMIEHEQAYCGKMAYAMCNSKVQKCRLMVSIDEQYAAGVAANYSMFIFCYDKREWQLLGVENRKIIILYVMCFYEKWDVKNTLVMLKRDYSVS